MQRTWVLLAFVMLGLLSMQTFAGEVPARAEEVPYGVTREKWPRNLGNHRVRISVSEKADAVWVRIPWRRRDANPEKKDIVIIDAKTGKQIENFVRVDINREFGDIVFQPATAPGEYYVYYMPYMERRVCGPGSPVDYFPPKPTADAAWLQRHVLMPELLDVLPKAKVLEFQARTEFDRFDPMEVVATADEMKKLLVQHPKRPYLMFPEDRRYPIRMTDNLPLCWIKKGPSTEFNGEALRGEFYVFQIGVYTAQKALENLAVDFGELRLETGTEVIPASAFRCFNLGGVDWLGRSFKKTYNVAKGNVGALWFGVQISDEAKPGNYQGTLTLRPKNAEPMEIKVKLEVLDQKIKDYGDGDLSRHTRLRWLDSAIGIDDEVVPPYTPLKVEGHTIKCLGRELQVGSNGLPASIRSNQNEILAKPVAMVVETEDGQVAWTGGEAKVIKKAPGAVTWQAWGTAGFLEMKCQARMEFDGYINFSVTLNARQETEVKDIRLEIPIGREIATYMMGMARKGGYRPEKWQWKWNIRSADNTLWIGEVDAGLYLKLKGPEDTWGMDLEASGIPQAWGNNGQGGCTVTEIGQDTVLVCAYSGKRLVKPEEELLFRFGMLVTPVKPLDPKAHWNQRYHHSDEQGGSRTPLPPEDVKKFGANIVNIHQGGWYNPYINYPFLTVDKLTTYVEEAHKKGIKAKLYYTVRELSNYVAEMWALRSLGNEVFVDGGGGGDAWLREHLVSHYAPAWHVTLPDGKVDAALATTGLSRWHNYYLEGLRWLLKNVEIDGIYLDGIGYDREIMKRTRKVMERSRPGCLIDFHSGNTFGYGNLRLSPACYYMEHFPYFDSLWLGEIYNYDESPDYWLVEISGIPFGLMGEMLKGGGNPWRGMVYGMTNRLGWEGDPRNIWKVWDDFSIQEAKMIGYWDPSCPVKTDRKDVLATVYCCKDKALVSLASWAKEVVPCELKIDWKALGLNPEKASLFAPAIWGFQEAALFRPGEKIPVGPARGWLLIIDEEKHEDPRVKTEDAYKGCKLAFEDRFDRKKLGEPWEIALSKQPDTELKLENGAITIKALANCYAFAERPLPEGTAFPEGKGTTLVECQVFSGSDKGAHWGPGLALVWGNKIFRINLRAEGQFAVKGVNLRPDEEEFGGYVEPNKWYYLHIGLEENRIVAAVSDDGNLWQTIFVGGRPREAPIAVRLGKMNCNFEKVKTGKNEDSGVPGEIGNCAIKNLRIFVGSR